MPDEFIVNVPNIKKKRTAKSGCLQWALIGAWL